MAPAPAAADVLDSYRAALDAVTTLTETSAVSCADEDLVELARMQEELSRRVEALTIQRFADNLQRRPAPMITSAGSISSFYEHTLNVGRGETRRRREHAARLATTHTLTGAPLTPTLPDTAHALRTGQISRTHADVIIKVMRKIPQRVNADTLACAESTLAEFATQLTPKNLERLGTRLLGYLDPDGQLTDDADRARRRSLHLSHQDQQLMSRLTADLTPTARATFDLALELFAAKGMNNPDDPLSPRGAANATGLDPHLLAEAANRDTRPLGQRQHDALHIICEYAITAAAAGATINGLPAQIIVTTAKADIDRQRGYATTATGTGTVLPVRDVVDLLFTNPDHPADTHLIVFDDNTHNVVYYGTGRRTASTAQRYAQFARDRGCTKPTCSRSMFACQSHHIHRWEYGGRTTISNLGAACGHDNRSEGPGADQWDTVILPDGPDAGRVGWIDPADPNRTPQVNNTHHPDLALRRQWDKRRQRHRQQPTRHVPADDKPTPTQRE